MIEKTRIAATIYAGPDWLDRLIGVAALVLFALAMLALTKGHAQWGAVSWLVWVHLAPAMLALFLTPWILGRRRGDALHRLLGWIWVAAMSLTAGSSLLVHEIRPGHFSVIHLLSLWTLVNLPLLVLSARRGDIARHRRILRGMAIGGLIIAGSFTFVFHRLLARWLEL